MGMRGFYNGGAKGVPSILGVFGLAPPCTMTGVFIGVGSGSVTGKSFVISDCILTEFGVANLLGVSLADVCNIGFLIVFIGEDFPVTLGNLDFD